jgi:outer membrane protein TolC
MTMIRSLVERTFLIAVLVSALPVAVQGAEQPQDDLLKGPVLSLRSAIARAIQENLNLLVVELDVPVSEEEVTANDAIFDPTVESGFFSQEAHTPTDSVFLQQPFDLFRETGGDVGIRKKFRFGLESGLSFQTSRSEDNSSTSGLRPRYTSFLILDLTQPLLRDFGYSVNTTEVRISRNQVQQAAYGYLSNAQQLAQTVEDVYFNLAEALAVLRNRIQSRELARELLAGNRQKFERGVVPVTEVQQAETALASRQEEVVSAKQQVETIANRLKNLLEIGRDDPLFHIIIQTEEIPGVSRNYPALDQALEIALNNRPDLKQRHLTVTNQNIRLAYYRNQKLPRVDLTATFDINGLSGGSRPVTIFGQQSTSRNTGDYLDSLSRAAEHQGYSWSAGLRFSYPLGNRAAEARYRQTHLRVRQAIYEVKSLEEQVETEVKNAEVEVRRSLERVEVAEHFEKLAATLLEQETTRLREGLTDTFHILNFQDDLINARISKVQALTDFNQGLADLYRAMGRNLDRYKITAEIDAQGFQYDK